MATTDEFAQECRQAARSIRRLPADLRRALGQRVKPEVADPLAAEVRTAWTGPHAAALSAGTKTRVSGDPQLVVGGSRRVVSGGANVRQLAFGDEFGGGSRVGQVAGTSRRRAHRRRTTRQFPRTGQAAVFGTVSRRVESTFDRWTKIVDDVLRGFTNG